MNMRLHTFHALQVAADGYKPPAQSTSDLISALCANDSVLMVGRVSGVVQRYSLPHLTVEGTHLLRCRPYMLALNCNVTRMSVIDINGVLSFYDLSAKGNAGATQGEHLAFERKVGQDYIMCHFPMREGGQSAFWCPCVMKERGVGGWAAWLVGTAINSIACVRLLAQLGALTSLNHMSITYVECSQ